MESISEPADVSRFQLAAALSSIQLRKYSPSFTIRDNGGIQRGISNVEAKRISDEEAVTEITDHYGACVSLRHFPLIDALAMSANEDIVQLTATSA